MSEAGGARVSYRLPYGEAFRLAVRLWNAGEDVATGLAAAGYAGSLASAAIAKLSHTDPKDLEEMSTKRQRSSSGATTSGSTGKVSKPVRKYVKTCMARMVEEKYVKSILSISGIATAGLCQADLLCGITQGSSDTQRTGNNIRVKKIKFKGWFSDDAPNVGRLIVFWDRQANGAAPAVTDVLNSAAINAPYNTDTVVGHGGQRFSVFHDKRHEIAPNILATTDYSLVTVTHKCTKTTNFDGNTGLIADIVSNNLCWLWISNAATLDFSGHLLIEYEDV